MTGAPSPTCGTSRFSYLSFPHSLLQLEVVPVRHLTGHSNSRICAPRSEDQGATSEELSHVLTWESWLLQKSFTGQHLLSYWSHITTWMKTDSSVSPSTFTFCLLSDSPASVSLTRVLQKDHKQLSYVLQAFFFSRHEADHSWASGFICYIISVFTETFSLEIAFSVQTTP